MKKHGITPRLKSTSYFVATLNMNKLTNRYAIPLTAAAVAVSVLMAIRRLSNSNSVPRTELPKEITWLDQASFDVLTAMCDAYLPHFEPEDITESAIASCLDEYTPGFFDAGVEEIMKRKEFLCRGAVEQGVHTEVARVMQNNLSTEEKMKLYLFLKALSTSVGCAAVTGYVAAFQDLSLNDRVKGLRILRDAYISDLRSAFCVFKKLSAAVFVSFVRQGDNFSWKYLEFDPTAALGKPYLSAPEIDIPIKYPKVPVPTSIASIDTTSPDDEIVVLHADVVIVGSGSGGGMMASELVKAGVRVIVVEKGGYYNEKDFASWSEFEGGACTMDKGGLCTTEDGNIAVLSGACVGGGSTINWCASFNTPINVRREWASDCALPQFSDGGDFEESMKVVCKQMNVNSNFSYREEGHPDDDANFKVNTNNRLLWKGAKAVGLEPLRIPRNVTHCVDCGNCNIGCSYRSKQSTATALLEPLSAKSSDEDRLLHIIPYCKIDRVLFSPLDDASDQKKVAIGVEGTFDIYPEGNVGQQRDPPLITKRIRILSEIVVSACGSLHTPALLLRSKLAHPKIGKNLTLHPVCGVLGLFPEEMTGLSSGVGMGVVVYPNKDSLPISNPTGAPMSNFVIETPPLHAGLFYSVVPWSSGLAHKSLMLNYKHSASFINIPRDCSQESNCVTINAAGDPVLKYELTKQDEGTLLCAMEAQTRIMKGAGATFIAPFIKDNGKWFKKTGDAEEDNKNFEVFLESALSQGFGKFEQPLFSAHQMSSCRMAASPDKGPVQPSGEMWECRNLYVADGSVLPSSLGINPMMTIEAISHMISRYVMDRLGVQPEPAGGGGCAGGGCCGGQEKEDGCCRGGDDVGGGCCQK